MCIRDSRWRWWYNRSGNNIYKFNSSNHYGSIEKKTLTTDANGKVTMKPKLNGHGRYLIRVCDEVSGHCSGELFYTSSYSFDNKEDGQVARLNLKTDKKEYLVGETMNLEVPTSIGSRLLVSIENNESVLNSFWVDATEELTKIPVSVNKDMLPNIYAHITMIQSLDNDNDLPLRMYGVIPVLSLIHI